MSTQHAIPITVVVNGQTTVVRARGEDPLGSIIPIALRQTENTDQPPEYWAVRDADGTTLDLGKRIEDYDFPPRVRLYLVLMTDRGHVPITVVVNGQPTLVDATLGAPLGSIIPIALRQTHNLGQQPQNWELRDADGTLLDTQRRIKDYAFPPGVRLFLNLKAGVGGDLNATEQYVDPAVSRAKFAREIDDYTSLETDYRARGWFLMKAEWPEVVVMLASIKTSPPAIVMAVQFDYSNYDAEPPSVRLTNPFTGKLLAHKELPTRLPRMIVGPEIDVPIAIDGDAKMRMQSTQDLMQAHSPDAVPFLCIPGVKEYHDHPGHSGDPWELHRTKGAGRLVRLLEVISKYGLEPIKGFGVNLAPQVTFAVSEPPQ